MSPAPHFLLAAPSRRALLRRRQVADILGLTVSALEKWAEKGTGPRFYRRGLSPRSPTRYRIEDVEQYVRDQGGEEVLATLVTGW
jgi:hypothetical protein